LFAAGLGYATMFWLGAAAMLAALALNLASARISRN
jgi:hypothetical protein